MINLFGIWSIQPVLIFFVTLSIVTIYQHWPKTNPRHVLYKNKKYAIALCFFSIYQTSVKILSKRWKNRVFVKGARALIEFIEFYGYLEYIYDPERVSVQFNRGTTEHSGLERKWIDGPKIYEKECEINEFQWRLFIITPSSLKSDSFRDTLIYYHGGGMITGSPVGIGTMVAKLTGKQVIGVKYRLSPESSYPGPIDD